MVARDANGRLYEWEGIRIYVAYIVWKTGVALSERAGVLLQDLWEMWLEV
jgi:hypothetical protein